MRDKRQRLLPSTVIVRDAMGNKHAVTADKDDAGTLASRLRFNHPEYSSAEGFTVNAQGFDHESCMKGHTTRDLNIRKARG
jgi:hypothetical protein